MSTEIVSIQIPELPAAGDHDDLDIVCFDERQGRASRLDGKRLGTVRAKRASADNYPEIEIE